jgi:hypothetical protein
MILSVSLGCLELGHPITAAVPFNRKLEPGVQLQIRLHAKPSTPETIRRYMCELFMLLGRAARALRKGCLLKSRLKSIRLPLGGCPDAPIPKLNATRRAKVNPKKILRNFIGLVPGNCSILPLGSNALRELGYNIEFCLVQQ